MQAEDVLCRPPGTASSRGDDAPHLAHGDLLALAAPEMTLGLDVTPAVAQSLYAAILTDTGSFRFSNTSPRAHSSACRAAR